MELRTEPISLHGGEEDLSFIQLSDLHLKFSDRSLKEAEDVLFRVRPQLVLCTGDYYDTGRGRRLFLDFLDRMRPFFPFLLIRGNHDSWWGWNLSAELEKRENLHGLDTAPFYYTSPKGHAYLFTSWQQQQQAGLLPGTKQVVLLHNPEKIRAASIGPADLVVAGHLHGGQFVFFKRGGKSFPVSLLYRYCTDRAQIGPTTLIVSRGMGDTLPLRFRCPHEIVHIRVS